MYFTYHLIKRHSTGGTTPHLTIVITFEWKNLLWNAARGCRLQPAAHTRERSDGIVRAVCTVSTGHKGKHANVECKCLACLRKTNDLPRQLQWTCCFFGDQADADGINSQTATRKASLPLFLVCGTHFFFSFLDQKPG